MTRLLSHLPTHWLVASCGPHGPSGPPGQRDWTSSGQAPFHVHVATSPPGLGS